LKDECKLQENGYDLCDGNAKVIRKLAIDAQFGDTATGIEKNDFSGAF
jgi:hypothetical protein